MFKMGEYSKLVLSALIIMLLSRMADIYLKLDEESAGVSFKFHNNVDIDWVKQLQDYLVDVINWDNGTFTKSLGYCETVCRENRSSTVSFFDFGCATNPLLLFNSVVKENRIETVSYAETTLPCFLKLKPSKIPNAHRGIFTTHRIQKGVVFGPYTGIIRSAYGKEGDLAQESGYSWRVNRPYMKDSDFFIDAVDENNSNWLRYVNAARYEEEQQLFPLLFNDTVYYLVYKDVEPDNELLVWYGYEYAKYLNIFVIEGSNHNWDTDFAPKVAETICPSCPRTVGIKRKEKVDTVDTNELSNER